MFRKRTFSVKIDLGHVITMVLVLVALVAGFARAQTQISEHGRILDAHTSSLESLSRLSESAVKLAEIEAALRAELEKRVERLERQADR